jgi:hypothetical protein
MGEKSYSDELARTLARPDADLMCRQLDAYAKYYRNDKGDEQSDEYADDFGEIMSCYHDDPEKAFAYVVLGASRTDDAGFLAFLGCGPLEGVLDDPSDELLERIVAEARKSNRFRWLLSHPFKVAVADRAWLAIEKFRSTGPHEEPSFDTLPPR